MLPVPSNETPPMVLAVSKAVAVSAFPVVYSKDNFPFSPIFKNCPPFPNLIVSIPVSEYISKPPSFLEKYSLYTTIFSNVISFVPLLFGFISVILRFTLIDDILLFNIYNINYFLS